MASKMRSLFSVKVLNGKVCNNFWILRSAAMGSNSDLENIASQLKVLVLCPLKFHQGTSQKIPFECRIINKYFPILYIENL
jgi:hypothetical protein